MQVILILLVLLPVIPLYAQLDADRTDEVAHIGYTRVISEKVDRPLEFSLAMHYDGGDNRYSLEYMTLNDVEQNIYVLSFEATPEELDELYQFFRSSTSS